MAISQIVQNSLADTISLGPKITSVQVANSTYVVKDDTSINIGGGFIVITGSGFQSNCSVIVDSNLACSVAFVSATQVRAQLPAKPAGTYNIYLLNGDGGTAIRVNALQYSNTPTWVTDSPLANQLEDSPVSIQLSATGANTYALQTGSTLPAGLTLSANGLISGTVNTNVLVDTTYNFTVEAIDTELQETPKAFAVTITVADPYFNLTTIYLDGDGTSGANNNVFRDSSNNNLTITKVANTAQGSFSPFSPAGWSTYFDGAQDYVEYSANTLTQFGTGDYTVEGWLNMSRGTSLLSYWRAALCTNGDSASGSNSGTLYIADAQSGSSVAGELVWQPDNTDGNRIYGGVDLRDGLWHHFAVTRTSGFVRLFVDGVYRAGRTNTTNLNAAGSFQVGSSLSSSNGGGGNSFLGHLSNIRLIKGTSLYTSNTTFTPSTTALTDVSGTSALTCNTNRHRDSSARNLAIALISGTPTITPFSPFAPDLYSAATHGGSAYFDGSGDRLDAPSGSVSGITNNQFTIECWLYPETFAVESLFRRIWSIGTGLANDLTAHINTNGNVVVRINDSIVIDNGTLQLNAWNHVVVSRNSSNLLKLHINGVLVGSTTNSTNFSGQTANPLYIGNEAGRTDGTLKGYVSSFRVVPGTDVYGNGSYTVPTTPLTAITNTSFLANFTNAGIYDWTTRSIIETVGSVSINTAVTKNGTGSIRFNTPIGPRLRIPESPFTLFNQSDFTIECWYYPITKPDIAPTVISNDEVAGYPSNYWALHDRHNTDGFSGTRFSFWMGNAVSTGSPLLVSSTTVSNNNWYHLAVTRSSNTIRLFVNGTLEASNTSTSASLDGGASKPIVMGRTGYGDSGANALIDDVRVTKGYARYTANFTPPTVIPKK